MMRTYFNTHTFDKLTKENDICITNCPQEADLLVLGAARVDYSNFSSLKAVYRFGIGSENIDFEFLKRRDIPVYFPSEATKNILYEATANFTVFGILSMLYQGAFGDADLWKKKERDYLGEKIVLVIGTGNIGRRVAEKLKAFMKVKIYDISRNKPEELGPLIRLADVITIHIPLNKQTEGFFGKEKLSWAKPDTLFVNTARGALYDENSLYDKLSTTSCSAFFDVFWKEPYEGKLKSLGKDKFFMTPHSASNIKEFVQAGFNEILKLIEDLNNGKA